MSNAPSLVVPGHLPQSIQKTTTELKQDLRRLGVRQSETEAEESNREV